MSPSVSIESASSAKAPADDFDAWMVALPLLSGEGRSPTKLQKPRARLPLLRSAALSHTPRTRRPRELEATR